MNKMLVLLDTEYVVDSLHTLLLEIHHKQSIVREGLPIPKPSHRTAIDIIYAITKDIIAGRSVFPIEVDEDSILIDLDVYIYAKLFNIDPKEVTKSEVDILNEFIYDRLYIEIKKHLSNQIEQHIKHGNHSVWKVIIIGKTLGMIEDEDYRIKEYYRLTESEREEQSTLNLNLSSIVDYIIENTVFGKRTSPSGLNGVTDEFLRLVVKHLIAETLVTSMPNLQLKNSGVLLSPKFLCAVEQFLFNFDYNHLTRLKVFIKNVLETYSYYALSSKLENDKFYIAEYISENIVFYLQSPETKSEDDVVYRRQLVLSLINGDYLPPEERSLAERYFQECPDLQQYVYG